MKPNYKTVFSEDPPAVIVKKTIYVIGTKKYPWQIIFSCPCGCTNAINLNLLMEVRPNWSYRLDNKKRISISPSICRTSGCKSHFFVRKGQIECAYPNWYHKIWA